MTPMQHTWIAAAILAGALFACAVAMVIEAASFTMGGTVAVAVLAPSISAFAVTALAAFGLVLFAARNARRP